MKKKEFKQKLFLNKKTVAVLNYNEMSSLRGGGKTEVGHTCLTDVLCCGLCGDQAQLVTRDC